jgi:hypothetical protein
MTVCGIECGAGRLFEQADSPEMLLYDAIAGCAKQ